MPAPGAPQSRQLGGGFRVAVQLQGALEMPGALARLEKGTACDERDRSVRRHGPGGQGRGHLDRHLRRVARLAARVEADPARLGAVSLVLPDHRFPETSGGPPVDVLGIVTGSVSAKAPILPSRSACSL